MRRTQRIPTPSAHLPDAHPGVHISAELPVQRIRADAGTQALAGGREQGPQGVRARLRLTAVALLAAHLGLPPLDALGERHQQTHGGLHQARLRLQASLQVGGREALRGHAVAAHDAPEELRGLQLAAPVHGDGHHVGPVEAAEEVERLYRVARVERDRRQGRVEAPGAVPDVELGREGALQLAHDGLQEPVELVLVAEPGEGGEHGKRDGSVGIEVAAGAPDRPQELPEVVACVRHTHHRTIVKRVAGLGRAGVVLGLGRLRDGEQVAERLGMEGEHASVDAERDVLCADDDVSVLEPDC